MTGAAAMTAFTPPADARLHAYLSQVRHALYGHPDVSPDEVEADVREHIATEFAHLNRPVTLGELETVLERLGPPTQWAPASQAVPKIEPFDWTDFLVRVRRRALGVFATLWRGPEDWRLPYLTFGLTLLAIPTAGISLIVAYFFGRAAVELAKEKGQPLGARRWLVYPAILAVVFPLLSAILFTPGLVTGRVAVEAAHSAHRWEKDNWQTVTMVKEQTPPPAKGERPAPAKWSSVPTPLPAEVRAGDEWILRAVRTMPGGWELQEFLFAGFAAVGGLAAWWTVLGLLFWAFPKWPTTFFHPLLDGYEGRHGARLAAWAGAALVVWGGFAYRILEAARTG